MKKIILILILALAGMAGATTYYCDFAGGSDAAAGTSTGAAWKHCPGMQSRTGNVASYAWHDRDTFKFKGGVTWDSSCFPDTINTGTYSGGHYVFRSDSSWYTGGSFALPIFDLMLKPTKVVFSCWYHPDVKFDGFEITHAKCNNGSDASDIFYFAAEDTQTLNNIYVHDFHPPTGYFADMNLVTFNSCSKGTVAYCRFMGLDSGGSGPITIGSGSTYKMLHNTIDHVNQGFLISGTTSQNVEIAYNTITRIYAFHYDSLAHTNAIFVYSPGGATCGGTIHHNILHDCITMGLWSNGGNWMFYDNVIYNWSIVQPMAWENTVDCPTCSLRVFNNYIASGGFFVVSRGTKTGYLEIRNNVLPAIYISDTITKTIINNNLYLGQDSTTTANYIGVQLGNAAWVYYTPAVARAAGWDTASYWSTTPHLATNGQDSVNSVTVGRAKTETAWFTTDILGNSRGTSGWDIGAYQYGGAAPPTTDTLTYAKATIHRGQSASLSPSKLVGTPTAIGFVHNGAIPGMTINPATGVISGTPTIKGTRYVLIYGSF